MRSNHPIFAKINSALVDLPAPNNISLWWNFGSLLGLCLRIQLTTGLFLSIHYRSNIEIAFSSVIHISQNVNLGWVLRIIHANGASIFFLFLYLHIGRGLYYRGCELVETWNIGVTLFILTIATAFIGYVLPWGQIRFWGATVITNLFSAFPYFGKYLVEWIWGGFAVDNATLNRFFALHFLLPFIISFIALLHIIFLHQSGSSNPLGINSDRERIPFHSYYSVKDIIGYIVSIIIFIYLVLYLPNILTDPENFLLANPLVTPIHIKPEWYFLWVYGVIALFAALLILFLPPITQINKIKAISFYPIAQLLYWRIIASWLILTWIGGCPVEEPYILTGQIFTTSYFLYFIIGPISNFTWDNLNK